MPHPESSELQQARHLLASFEQHPTEPDGLRALADALPELSDLAESSLNDHERTVAGNLLTTYARRAEERANQLLADFESIPDEDLEQWHDVMRQFEEASRALPESFGKTRATLIRRLVERLLGQLSPSERKALLAKLQSQSQ
jgi:hypothetical protein